MIYCTIAQQQACILDLTRSPRTKPCRRNPALAIHPPVPEGRENEKLPVGLIHTAFACIPVPHPPSTSVLLLVDRIVFSAHQTPLQKGIVSHNDTWGARPSFARPRWLGGSPRLSGEAFLHSWQLGWFSIYLCQWDGGHNMRCSLQERVSAVASLAVAADVTGSPTGGTSLRHRYLPLTTARLLVFIPGSQASLHLWSGAPQLAGSSTFRPVPKAVAQCALVRHRAF
jgi:hypothetical protein